MAMRRREKKRRGGEGGRGKGFGGEIRMRRGKRRKKILQLDVSHSFSIVLGLDNLHTRRREEVDIKKTKPWNW